MSTISATRKIQRTIYLIILFVVTLVLTFAALALPLFIPFTNSALQVGAVATQDIQAPRAISFESKILTAELQEAAERSVAPVYTSPDTGVARKQLEELRAALTFISSVRADEQATLEQKQADLSAMEKILMSQDLSLSILSLSDARWQAVQQEAIVVLEQVMRNTIREDRVEETRRSLPALVSLSLTEEQAMIVAELVKAFVTPNSFSSEELTEAAIENARQAVAPVTRSFKTGETIVQRGQVIDATDIEALQVLGLVQPQYSWRDFASAATLAFLMVGMVSLYLKRKRELIRDNRALAMLVFLFLLWLLVARWVIPGHVLLPYLFPIAAFGMIVSVLISTEVGLICTTALVILVVFEMPQSVELASYYILSSYFGILSLGRAHRVTSYFVAGLAVAASGAATAIAFRLVDPSVDLIGLTSISGTAVVNGFASTGLTILFQYFMAQLLGLTTALQLMELSRPDHPLLQMLLRNAPGTYQHSLQVANLAEQAAERIGADTLLTRVGALYHDIGKAANAPYFIENQGTGNVNPHDKLDPETSAQTIIQHVLDGLELARKYRLPRRIQNFVLEHHGDMITRYQYARAVKESGGDEDLVDLKTYVYPGPAPASKETAILMLADGCEARVRAERPKNEEELAEIIKSVIKHRLSDGQLDNTNLTMSELSELADAFTTTLRGMYHPRIEYPKLETRQKKPVDSTPTLPSGNLISVEAPKNEINNQAGEENGDAGVDSSEV